MYIAVTQYILGVKAAWEGLRIKPCLPKEWKNAVVTRRFRGCDYTIEIENHGGPAREIVIPHEEGRKEYRVKITL